ncbi:extracellular solute-binding protein [Actinomadura rubrisoli]|uniref:Carbohydrate ABC transporter substrate-binding protein n=1 Tax=Actinomadura rubrisoli TaxID=2530368 RepID=A0A4R5BKT2_9ACTN|nr:extracellular solute-binding protein [Actinomadura rubrisoli]TDD84422.1 carbohydrate ABC transporter substrate-binding protein [Actinomadura rubrisoli]
MTVRLLAALVLLCGLTAACGSAPDKTVTVLGTWTGSEADAFKAVLSEFEKETGFKARYTGNRDARALLASELHNGRPHDTALFANSGELRSYAAAGALRPLGPPENDLTTATGPRGRRSYGIVVKASVKSLIWYDPRTISPDLRGRLAARQSWEGFARTAAELAPRPWCLGLADRSNSGWPGTDWIEDILLHEEGPEVYDDWVSGRLDWTSAPMRRAWQRFGSIVAGSGTRSILTTDYEKAGASMAPPGCRLTHAASFFTAFQSRSGGRDFVPFPGGQAVEVGGDFLGVFHDTEPARRLVAYLTTVRAQKKWIKQQGSGAFSLNPAVQPGDYPDALSQRIARILKTAEKDVHFDASDSMPTVMAAAFNHAVLEFTADPRRLDTILGALDKVRRATPSTT